MRNALLALLLTVVGAFGLAAMPSNAQAYDNTRIYVDLGDVSFSYGRPYYRHDRSPLYISYDRYHQPRYYRYGPRRVYRSAYYDPYYSDPYYYNRVIVRPRGGYYGGGYYGGGYYGGGYYRGHHHRGGHSHGHHGRRHR